MIDVEKDPESEQKIKAVNTGESEDPHAVIKASDVIEKWAVGVRP